VLDLNDAEFVTSTRVYHGTYLDAATADVTVITAGAKQKLGETRTQLIDRNYAILQSIFEKMKPLNPNLVIILVANPVDVLTQLAHHFAPNHPRSQIFGSGTFLDTMRLRGLLSQKLNVNANAIHAYVLGEHGDRQFVAWSSARVGAISLSRCPGYESLNREAIQETVMKKAYTIIESKGATYFGIGVCVAQLCESVLFDRKDVRCVSCWSDKYNVAVSLPAVIGRSGVQNTLATELNASEEEKMIKAVKAIDDACKACLRRE